MLLPLFVLIERGRAAPMLDLSIFENRMFAAATGAAFINGLSRFALLFIFVFYFQGVQGDDADHRRDQARADGDRDADLVAARGHLGRPARVAGAGRARHGRHGGGLALMTTIETTSPYWQSALWLGPRGDRLGNVQLARTPRR